MINENINSLVKPRYYRIQKLEEAFNLAECFYKNFSLVIDNFKKFSSREIIRYEDNIDKFESFKRNDSSLEGFWVQKRYGVGFFDSDKTKYSDSFFQFVLGKGDKEGAIASFEPWKNALIMTQIQGFKDGKDIWSIIDYPKFFISCLKDFAIQSNIPEIFVLPLFRNRYENVRENKHGEIKKYDLSAKKMGLNLDLVRGVFYESVC